MKKIESNINNFRRKLNLNVPKEVISTFGYRGNEEMVDFIGKVVKVDFDSNEYVVIMSKVNNKNEYNKDYILVNYDDFRKYLKENKSSIYVIDDIISLCEIRRFNYIGIKPPFITTGRYFDIDKFMAVEISEEKYE